ncbi:hypothetical protein [Novipirellula rosea]|uniref:Uncharacterized protein n=1 Tax=Novipirellula rosea TaxID=1031540 RepID=A0ABP8N274_9BACT|tara:strand:+ start:2641 stop:3039 length:399 start_codon:yes stop_codon:yes gene_type:complete
MLTWLKHLRQRWDNWCGDHDMEEAIRKHLSDNGYYGRTAKFRNVRIVAVQRPGWLQVFRFDVTARLVPPEADSEMADPPPVYHDLYGLVKDDIRHKINVVRVFDCEHERRSLFTRWSEDMICLRGAHGLKNS